MMKYSVINTSILCPINDAESFTIVSIAKRLGYEVRISLQNGGFCPLFREPSVSLKDLKKNVIIIEMPGLEVENILRKKGHFLKVIDHHDYVSLDLNRDNCLSSLEQFALVVKYKLSLFEKAVAINDQKYIYGMVEMGLNKSLIKDVRKLDLLLQGYTDKDFEMLKFAYKTSRVRLNKNTFLYQSNVVDKFSYLQDLHIFGKNLKHSNIVICGKAGGGKEKFIWFSGRSDIVKKLKRLGGFSKMSTAEYGYWGGFGKGIEEVDFKNALNIIKTCE